MREYNTFLKTAFLEVHPKLSPLAFWPQHSETFPALSLLAEAFCGINKSEVKVESLFSVCGILTVDRRNSLGEGLRNTYCQIWSALPRNPRSASSKPKASSLSAKDKVLQFAEDENLLLKDTQAGPMVLPASAPRPSLQKRRNSAYWTCKAASRYWKPSR